MFTGIVTDIARERASLLRDIEYMRNNVKDARMQEDILLYESAETGLCMESDIIPADEKKEIKEIIDQIPSDNSDEVAEVERIVTSDKESLSLDEVMGLVDEQDPDDGDEVDLTLDQLDD